MSGFVVSVLYPSVPDAEFNMEYYNAKHIPLVSERWAKYGLKKYVVADLTASKGPYSYQCTLVFDGPIENFQKAVDETGPEVMGDVKNFSSIEPILLTGALVNSN